MQTDLGNIRWDRAHCILLLCCLVLASVTAHASEFQWDESTGGSFLEPGNWFPTVDPESVPNDQLVFRLRQASPYAVTLGRDATVGPIKVADDRVLLDLQGHTLTTVDPLGFVSLYVFTEYTDTSELSIRDGMFVADGISVGVFNGAPVRGSLNVESDAIVSFSGRLTVGGGNSAANPAIQSEGMLSVYDGGVVQAIAPFGNLLVGGINGQSTPLGIGHVSVDGAGSLISVTNVQAGRDGEAYLTVSNGGAIEASSAIRIAEVSGSQGRIDIESGGVVTADFYAIIGDQGQAYGTISGAGSTFQVNTSGLTIGAEDGSIGELLIDDGGLASSFRGRIAARPGSTGMVEISGSTSSWELVQNLYVGGSWDSAGSGAATLTLTDNATLRVGQELIIGEDDILALSSGRGVVGTASLPAATSTLLISNGGVLSGSGTVVGDVQVVGGVVGPGFSPGTLRIDGNLTLDTASVLSIEIDGAPGSALFDKLEVTGSVQLGGMVQFDFSDYVPSPGASYDFIEAVGGLSGAFSQFSVIGFSGDTRFDPATGTLHVLAVPEPTSCLLLSFAMFALALRWRSLE